MPENTFSSNLGVDLNLLPIENLSGIQGMDLTAAGPGSAFSNQFNVPSTTTGIIPGQDVGSGWSWFGGKNDNTGMKDQSIIGAGLGVGKGLLDSYLGLQSLGVAKDALSFKKDAFSKQFENQQTLLNAEMRDRQRARVSANPAGHQSVEQYMAENRL